MSIHIRPEHLTMTNCYIYKCNMLINIAPSNINNVCLCRIGCPPVSHKDPLSLTEDNNVRYLTLNIVYFVLYCTLSIYKIILSSVFSSKICI